jgi:predicted dienelactone hydrolase
MTLATSDTSMQRAPEITTPVGFATRRIVPPGSYEWRGAKTHALVTSIWYPAAAGTTMKPQFIGPPNAPLFVGGEWTEGAALAPGKHPIILLSHGTGGTPESLAWLARGLAARGYIVAGVNHPGNNALEAYTAEGFLWWWERARDLTTMLDALLEDKTFGGAVDVTRVGVTGLSLGGYTGFVLAGARTDPQRLLDYCASPNAEGCGDPPEFPNLFATWKSRRENDQRFRDHEAQAGGSFADRRVRAVFAMAPAIAQTFVPDSLKDVKVPVEIVVGAADTLAPPATNAEYLAKETNGKVTVLPGAVAHYTFLATCTDNGRREMSGLCTDAPGVDRDAVHDQTIDLAVNFFDRTLR